MKDKGEIHPESGYPVNSFKHHKWLSRQGDGTVVAVGGQAVVVDTKPLSRMNKNELLGVAEAEGIDLAGFLDTNKTITAAIVWARQERARAKE